MTSLYIYDDATARLFEPFTVTRPLSEMRAGAELIRKRWERAAARRSTGFLSAAHLRDFVEFDCAGAATDQDIPAGSLVVNSRFVVALDDVLATGDTVWACDGEVCAVRLRESTPAVRFADGSATLRDFSADESPARLRGRWLTAVWDLVATLSPQLSEDITALAPTVHASSLMYDCIGSRSLTIEQGAQVEPYVIFDVTVGPVMVRQGASIAAFTRVVGPCYIGAGSTLLGDRIANCSIGDGAKIRGEISSSIVLGHSNKGHTGFIGHSYLGRWVNLGSGTTTSNLKNTYGTVQLWTPTGIRETGQQFLGTLFGDHTKTGIGTMLTTGTVLGAGANVFGSSMPPKYVPPFAWGDGEPYATFESAKFLAVADRVMARRNVVLGDREREHLRRVHAERAAGAAAVDHRRT